MATDFRQTVQSWLDGNFDEETKAEILALQESDLTALDPCLMSACIGLRVCRYSHCDLH